jgi:antitoxin (DNA-binding transcriptional repressor) of toxin-antitoxin stability system
MIALDFREVIERFDEILDAVERGEKFSVLRDGRPIAIMEKSEAQDLDQTASTGPA